MHNLSLILIAHWLEPVLVCVSGVVWGMSYWPRPKRAPNAFCLWHCLLSNYREWGTNRKAGPGWDIKNRCGGKRLSQRTDCRARQSPQLQLQLQLPIPDSWLPTSSSTSISSMGIVIISRVHPTAFGFIGARKSFLLTQLTVGSFLLRGSFRVHRW